MIFKQLFKPKWQHQDANVRLAALDKISTKEPQQLANLMKMAEADIDVRVRRKALEKINDFSIWWKTAKTEKDEVLAKQALNKVKAVLLDETNDNLTEDEKSQFIQQCHDKSVLETLYTTGNDIFSIALQIELLNKIDKPALDLETCLRRDEQALVECAYERLDKNTKSLERLAHKAKNELIKQQAQQALAELEKIAALPAELKKQASLILSKLLSLKDKADYTLIKQQGEALVADWNKIASDFSYLTTLEQAELTTKYETICQKVDSATQTLKQAWFEQQAIQAEKEQRTDLLTNINQQIVAAEKTISELTEVENETATENVLVQLQAIKSELMSSGYEGGDVQKLMAKIEQLLSDTHALPIYFEGVAELTKLLSQLAQQTLPETLADLDEKSALFATWFKQWKSTRQTIRLSLPQSIEISSKALIEQWRSALNGFQAGQDKKLKQLKNKLRELKSLIFAGKYNAAFGLFYRLNEWYDELTAANKQKVEKEYQQVHEKIDDLADWKEYIAIPRKKELLAEVESMQRNDLVEPVSQAKKIKQLRHVWKLLGNIKTEENTALNKAFDLATENAFAPCRLYYQEQEKIRAQNYQDKLAICEEVSILSQSFSQPDNDIASLGKKLSTIMNRWSDIGLVDRELYQGLNDQFFSHYKPLKEQVKQFQQDNLKAKQALIEQAKQLQNQENIADAIAKIKQLQQAWKQIDFAGPKKDKTLWNSFRQINDAIFARRDSEKQAERASRDEQLTLINEQIKAQLANLATISSLVELTEFIEQTQNILTDSHVSTLTDTQIKKTQASIDQLIHQAQQKMEALKTNKKQMGFNLFLTQFEQLFSNDKHTAIALKELDNQWRTLLTKATNAQLSDDISALTAQSYQLRLTLEIATELPPLDEDKAARMQLQVQLLAGKMNAGQQLEVLDIIGQWLALATHCIDNPSAQLLLDQQRIKAAINHWYQ